MSQKNFFDTIAKIVYLKGNNRKAFVKFMLLRFPKEQDIHNTFEWAKRWKSGEPEVYADSKSFKAIRTAKKLYNIRKVL